MKTENGTAKRKMTGNERGGGLLDKCKGVKMKYLLHLSFGIRYVLLRQISECSE